ncbi:hypothetical protein BJY00DRAFT_310207 [Aspergillus carlsbadensis]|nr:hypothetical protein BJY00DRAFT_310207 [Aspergillus carlsbadensis]
MHSQMNNCSSRSTYYICKHPGSGTHSPVPLDMTNYIHAWLAARNLDQAQQNTGLGLGNWKPPPSSRTVDITSASASTSIRSTSDRDVLRAWVAKFDQELRQLGSSVQELSVQLSGGEGAHADVEMEMDTDMDMVDPLPEMMEWLDINYIDVDIEIPDAPAWDLDGDSEMSEAESDVETEMVLD